MTISHYKNSNLLIPVVSSVAITMFLFYIDEGYYNFEWMASIGNWVAFVFYAIPMILGQFIISKIIPTKHLGVLTSLFTVVTGSSLGLLIVITAFIGLWNIY